MFNTIINQSDIPRMLDLSCVQRANTFDELNEMVCLAKQYRVICCFAMPFYTEWLIRQLQSEPDIHVGGVVGFPSGADLTEIKIATARALAAMGCDELDMVINLAALKENRCDIVTDEICRVIDAGAGRPVKAIIEVSCLTEDEIRRASECVAKSGASFVKTGTGWGKKPTTVEHIKLIHSVVGDSVQIKAAGGIRNLDTILRMTKAGCSRFGIGVASAIKIFAEIEQYVSHME